MTFWKRVRRLVEQPDYRRRGKPRLKPGLAGRVFGITIGLMVAGGFITGMVMLYMQVPR